jgi:hypothetical protein
MAINSNHTSEDLNDTKCAIVEKNVSSERADFLKSILTFNGYTVVIAASAPPKAAKVATPKTDTTEAEPSPVEAFAPPSTFTVGVTDMRFNPVNAVFGRSLKTAQGRIVTLAYWNQLETDSNDKLPYFEKNN